MEFHASGMSMGRDGEFRLDQTDVDRVTDIINGQHRRNLNYQRPTDLYYAHTVH